jgi:hypothetical protein
MSSIAKGDAAELRRHHNLREIALVSAAAFCVTACGLIPEVRVPLREVDFEVDPHANKGEAFVCHIVVAYSMDLYERLKGMDANGYFTSAESIERTYKDSIEIFRFDMIPGRNKINQAVKVRSRTKACGAYIFAKYSTPGRFMENIGKTNKIVVQFKPYKMEITSDKNLEDLKEGLESKKG